MFAAAVLMLLMSYAAVPLYKIFCEATGFGGTTQVGVLPEGEQVVLDRAIKVRFDANAHPSLPWTFRPTQTEISVQVGKSVLAFYEVENLSNKNVTGTATFNVTPSRAGQYFNKIECFCFQEQLLGPGEKLQMPVELFIDPRIADDKNLDDVHTITLSYTFFRDDMWQDSL